MKRTTRAVGWIWLIYSIYAVVGALVSRGELPIRFGVPQSGVGVGRPEIWTEADFAAILTLAAAIALLRRRPWGWWVLAVGSGISAAAILLVVVGAATGWPWVRFSGSPIWVTYLLCLGCLVPVTAALYLLLVDPPRGWKSGTAPGSEGGE